MKIIERICSDSGMQIVEVVQENDGSFMLRKFLRVYDPEEEKFYEVREFPDESSRFGELDVAVNEAKRLLGLKYM